VSVLLVEDEPAVRELVRMILERADYAMFDRTISEHGAAFIEKPFPADPLVNQVRDVLSQ
jgi:CheY-like chemotaxis protein